jgi:hypothetical protein
MGDWKGSILDETFRPFSRPDLWYKYAEDIYDQIRSVNGRCESVAQNTGMPLTIVRAVYEHVFESNSHIHEDPHGVYRPNRLTPNSELAEAWTRAMLGSPWRDGDISPCSYQQFRDHMLHEYFELRLEASGLPYRSPDQIDAHNLSPTTEQELLSGDYFRRVTDNIQKATVPSALQPAAEMITGLISAAGGGSLFMMAGAVAGLLASLVDISDAYAIDPSSTDGRTYPGDSDQRASNGAPVDEGSYVKPVTQEFQLRDDVSDNPKSVTDHNDKSTTGTVAPIAGAWTEGDKSRDNSNEHLDSRADVVSMGVSMGVSGTEGRAPLAAASADGATSVRDADKHLSGKSAEGQVLATEPTHPFDGGMVEASKVAISEASTEPPPRTTDSAPRADPKDEASMGDGQHAKADPEEPASVGGRHATADPDEVARVGGDVKDTQDHHKRDDHLADHRDREPVTVDNRRHDPADPCDSAQKAPSQQQKHQEHIYGDEHHG